MANSKAKRSIKKEIVGIIFLLLTLVFGGSLFSFHPHDPLFWEKGYGIVEEQNLFGIVGANLSGILFLFFGLSSFWLIAVPLFLSYSFFRGRVPSRIIWILLSLCILILSFSSLISLYTPGGVYYRGATISGGLAGSDLANLGKQILNPFGAYAFYSTIFIISFMVITKLSIGNIFQFIWSLFYNVIHYIKEKWLKFMEKRRRARQRKTVIEKASRLKAREMTIIKAPSSKPQQRRSPSP